MRPIPITTRRMSHHWTTSRVSPSPASSSMHHPQTNHITLSGSPVYNRKSQATPIYECHKFRGGFLTYSTIALPTGFGSIIISRLFIVSSFLFLFLVHVIPDGNLSSFLSEFLVCDKRWSALSFFSRCFFRVFPARRVSSRFGPCLLFVRFVSAYTYIYPWERLSDHSLLSFMRVLACSVELWLSLLSCYSITIISVGSSESSLSRIGYLPALLQ